MKKEFIMPPLVLMLICLITCGLLVFAYKTTYKDNTGVITDKLKGGLTEIYGSDNGFEMLKNDDGTVKTYEGITSVMKDADNNVAFEVFADGYSKGGLHVLVGISPDGTIKGVSILSISETPGLGTKVEDPAFLNQFAGVSADLFEFPAVKTESGPKKKAIWGTDEERKKLYDMQTGATSSDGGFEFDAVTGATFSSKGMKNAITYAAVTYTEKKGEIIGE